MRTTWLEIVWVGLSLCAVWFCVGNLRSALKDRNTLKSDATKTNQKTHSLRVVGAVAMLGSSGISASLYNPVPAPWRVTSQICLTVLAACLAIIPVIINRARRRVVSPGAEVDHA